jgi:uncharacterized protein involved in exopolysaccharide biosynthesis
MDEGIDLGEYIQALVRHWRWIAALVLVAAVVAFVVSSVRPHAYEARASLIMQRVHTEVAFTPSIRTQEENTLTRRTELELRLEGLTEFARSAAVAVASLEQLGDRVKSAEDLQGMVVVESKADLIFITARARDPQLAADVANEWARQAEKHINDAYGQSVSQTPNLEMQAQREDARDRYETSQTELETFLAQNRIPELSREIAYLRQVITDYQQVLADTEVAMYKTALDNNHQMLLAYYSELQTTEQVLVDAHALSQELQHASSAPATEWARALAFIDLQSRAFGGRQGAHEIVISGQAPATDSADLDWLIKSLENKVQDIEVSIRQQERDLLDIEPAPAMIDPENPLKQRIQTLSQKMLDLQSQLEAEQAREQGLTEPRDLAWETYRAITRELAETEIESQVIDTEVHFGSSAIRPERSVRPNRAKSTLIGGALGLMLGVFGVLFADYWQRGNFASQPGCGPES